MLNDFLSVFLGAYDSLIGMQFPEWYLLRGILAVAVLVAVLAFSSGVFYGFSRSLFLASSVWG